MARIELKHEVPHVGWLMILLSVDGQNTAISASDAANNPISDLRDAVEAAAFGHPSVVWWNLEPDGYFMHLVPNGAEIEFRLEFADDSEPSRAVTVFSAIESRYKLLILLWRFLREFQSHGYAEPGWPDFDPSRTDLVKEKILALRQASI